MIKGSMPYSREILNDLTINEPIKQVVVMKGAALGKTENVIIKGLFYIPDFNKLDPVFLKLEKDFYDRMFVNKNKVYKIEELIKRKVIKFKNENRNYHTRPRG